jgi:Ca2+-binding RTX toxin-like protein
MAGVRCVIPVDQSRRRPRADTIRGFGGADRIYGSAGDNRAFGGRGRDTIWGQSGDDLLSDGYHQAPVPEDSWTTADVFYGGVGADRFEVDGRDVVHAGRGDDLVRVAYMRHRTVISCGKGDDTLVSFSDEQFDGTFVSCERVRHHPAG